MKRLNTEQRPGAATDVMQRLLADDQGAVVGQSGVP